MKRNEEIMIALGAALLGLGTIVFIGAVMYGLGWVTTLLFHVNTTTLGKVLIGLGIMVILNWLRDIFACSCKEARK